MRKQIALILILLFSLKNFAQKPVIALEKMNVLYMGVTNPISVAVEGIDDSKLKVTIDNGSIAKNSDGGYDVLTSKTGLAIVSIEWHGGKAEKKFRVLSMSDPEPSLSNSSEYNSYPKESYTGVIAIIMGYGFDAKALIHSFKMTRFSKKKEFKEIIAIGCCDKSSFELMLTAQKDDTIIFSEIKCKLPGDILPRTLRKTITCHIRD